MPMCPTNGPEYHTNKVIDNDFVEIHPPDPVLLEAQLRWYHTEVFHLGMVRF
jgi:hypothetical protein